MIHKIHHKCLIICLFFLMGCDSTDPETDNKLGDQPLSIKSHNEVAETHTHDYSRSELSYQKPGANVRLSHNYDGHTTVGETETIKLTFTEQYASGQMYLRLKPDTALSIEPAFKDYVFSMGDKSTHTIEISVSAKSAGKHLLNIFASVMDEGGKPRNRIMAIALYVGDNNHRHSKPEAPSSTDKVIVLPSIESGG